MHIVYAIRRCTLYPTATTTTDLPPDPAQRKAFLRKIRDMGFDGVELRPALPDSGEVTEATVQALRKELEDAHVPCLAVRGGGGLTHPRTATANQKRLEDAIHYASWIGADLVNTILGEGMRDPGGPGSGLGQPVSQGSSRLASEENYDRTARGLTKAADIAANLNLNLTVEIHQHTICDNSWSAHHLLDLINRENVGVNPDLGNIYWTYETPEETCEDAICSLAPRAGYWHCKNLTRVHIPDVQHAIFLQVPLPDGEIDYRFALTAMVNAGYDGCIAIEGLRLGDQFYGDQKSVAYVKDLLEELKK
ncbi:MAG: sugar phosphate isomerase/epimerase [bacterium]|nr:sugar phosphate isomerase/epimerase [bacterium]